MSTTILGFFNGVITTTAASRSPASPTARATRSSSASIAGDCFTSSTLATPSRTVAGIRAAGTTVSSRHSIPSTRVTAPTSRLAAPPLTATTIPLRRVAYTLAARTSRSVTARSTSSGIRSLYCNSFSRSLSRFRGGIASGVGVASFRSLRRRDDRSRTSRDLPPAPLDTRQTTEAETATGKLGWLEHTGPLEDAESLPLLRQNQADELLQ